MCRWQQWALFGLCICLCFSFDFSIGSTTRRLEGRRGGICDQGTNSPSILTEALPLDASLEQRSVSILHQVCSANIAVLFAF